MEQENRKKSSWFSLLGEWGSPPASQIFAHSHPPGNPLPIRLPSSPTKFLIPLPPTEGKFSPLNNNFYAINK